MRRALKATSIVVACLAAGSELPAQPAVAATLQVWGSHASGPRLPPPDGTAAVRDSIVALARAQLGRRYRLGGTSPARGFDCSGLVQFVLHAVGLEVPRTAAEQARVGVGLAPEVAHLRPGDLLIFGEPAIDHIGIYVGDGRFIHASSVAGRVIESPVERPPAPLIKPWAGSRALDDLLAGLVDDERR